MRGRAYGSFGSGIVTVVTGSGTVTPPPSVVVVAAAVVVGGGGGSGRVVTPGEV